MDSNSSVSTDISTITVAVILRLSAVCAVVSNSSTAHLPLTSITDVLGYYLILPLPGPLLTLSPRRSGSEVSSMVSVVDCVSSLFGHVVNQQAPPLSDFASRGALATLRTSSLPFPLSSPLSSADASSLLSRRQPLSWLLWSVSARQGCGDTEAALK